MPRKTAWSSVLFYGEKENMGKREYRLRDRQLNIRVTGYEYRLIQERMKKAGAASLREFMVESATNGYLINVDYSDIKALAYEINRIGNNINQIAYKINSENAVYKNEIEEVRDKVDLIWKMIRAKFYQIP